MRVASAADVSRWLASETCRCGARELATDPVLAERGGTLVLRAAGCGRCGEPAYVDAQLPEPIERAVAGKHVLDPSAIALLAPFVANGFPDYAGAPPETIDMSAIAMPAGWRVIEWLRGSFGYGQARCMRGDGVRALATFSRAPRGSLDRVVDSLPAPTRGVARILDAQLAGPYAVLFEAEPAGLPLSTSMFPLALDLALLVFGRLLDIASDAGSHGSVLRGLRPELVYLEPGLVVSAAPRAEQFAMSAPESRDTGPVSPFETLYGGPEGVRGERLTATYDVFACCAMFLFLLTRRPPFPGPSPMHQLAAMMKAPPPLPASLDPRTAELVRAGLSPDPAKRPTASELRAAVVVS